MKLIHQQVPEPYSHQFSTVESTRLNHDFLLKYIFFDPDQVPDSGKQINW